MERLPSPIYASEALLAYVILGDGLTEELRAIRRLDLRSEAEFASALRADTPTWVSERDGRRCSYFQSRLCMGRADGTTALDAPALAGWPAATR
jgi:hypothetical protein